MKFKNQHSIFLQPIDQHFFHNNVLENILEEMEKIQKNKLDCLENSTESDSGESKNENDVFSEALTASSRKNSFLIEKIRDDKIMIPEKGNHLFPNTNSSIKNFHIPNFLFLDSEDEMTSIKSSYICLENNERTLKNKKDFFLSKRGVEETDSNYLRGSNKNEVFNMNFCQDVFYDKFKKVTYLNESSDEKSKLTELFNPDWRSKINSHKIIKFGAMKKKVFERIKKKQNKNALKFFNIKNLKNFNDNSSSNQLNYYNLIQKTNFPQFVSYSNSWNDSQINSNLKIQNCLQNINNNNSKIKNIKNSEANKKNKKVKISNLLINNNFINYKDSYSISLNNKKYDSFENSNACPNACEFDNVKQTNINNNMNFKSNIFEMNSAQIFHKSIHLQNFPLNFNYFNSSIEINKRKNILNCNNLNLQIFNTFTNERNSGCFNIFYHKNLQNDMSTHLQRIYLPEKQIYSNINYNNIFFQK